jgi:hypothetical protein
MAVPSLHVPCRPAPLGIGVPVTRDKWLRAARRTDAELWALAHMNQPTGTVKASPMAETAVSAPRATLATTAAEGPYASAPSHDAGVTWSRRESASEHRAQLKAEGWTFADEAGSAARAKRKKPTRYLPPEPRFVSWIEARGGSASLSAIARRFNLTAAEVDVLLSRLTAAGAGLVMYHHGRGGGRRFVLLRTPRHPTGPVL